MHVRQSYPDDIRSVCDCFKNHSCVFLFFLGGVCISPKKWNSEYLCIDHYQPLRFGCYKGECFLQCERAQSKYCLAQKQVSGAWSKQTCTEHQDCASLDLICKDRCRASQLQRFEGFYNSNQVTTIPAIPSGYLRTDASTGE